MGKDGCWDKMAQMRNVMTLYRQNPGVLLAICLLLTLRPPPLPILVLLCKRCLLSFHLLFADYWKLLQSVDRVGLCTPA